MVISMACRSFRMNLKSNVEMSMWRKNIIHQTNILHRFQTKLHPIFHDFVWHRFWCKKICGVRLTEIDAGECSQFPHDARSASAAMGSTRKKNMGISDLKSSANTKMQSVQWKRLAMCSYVFIEKRVRAVNVIVVIGWIYCSFSVTVFGFETCRTVSMRRFKYPTYL